MTESKVNIVKAKLIVTQALSWYAVFVNGPMIAYVFYRSVPFDKGLALLMILGGVLCIFAWTIIYFKYLYPVELEYCFDVSDRWKEMEKK